MPASGRYEDAVFRRAQPVVRLDHRAAGTDTLSQETSGPATARGRWLVQGFFGVVYSATLWRGSQMVS